MHRLDYIEVYSELKSLLLGTKITERVELQPPNFQPLLLLKFSSHLRLQKLTVESYSRRPALKNFENPLFEKMAKFEVRFSFYS
jgi:hypothetical protein